VDCRTRAVYYLLENIIIIHVINSKGLFEITTAFDVRMWYLKIYFATAIYLHQIDKMKLMGEIINLLSKRF